MEKLSSSKREMEFKVKEIPIEDITVLVHVEFTRLFKIRMWLGFRLIKLLGWLWTCDIRVEENDEFGFG